MRQPFVNQSLAKMAGFPNRKEMQGKTVFECFPPELAAKFYQENRGNLGKISLMNEYANSNRSIQRFSFVKPKKLAFFLTQMMHYGEFIKPKAHASLIHTLYTMVSGPKGHSSVVIGFARQ